jgi:nitrate reductase NapE component
MNNQTLVILEQAIEPYRKEGFIVTSQLEGAITLIYPSKKFSYLAFIFWLVVFWPIAAIYLISYNNQKDRSVCIRITSQGLIEESGYTLKVIESERRRDWWLAVIAITIFVISVIALLMMILHTR